MTMMILEAPVSYATDNSAQAEVEELERAAAQIQRWWRKYHHLVHDKSDIPEESEITKFRLEKAAARIQRWWRKCRAFLRQKTSESAAEIRLQKAAARIQRWWREYYWTTTTRNEQQTHKSEDILEQHTITVPNKLANANTMIGNENASNNAVTLESESVAARQIQRWWRKKSPRCEKRSKLDQDNSSRQCSTQLTPNAIQQQKKDESQQQQNQSRQLSKQAEKAARQIQRWWRNKFDATTRGNKLAFKNMNEKDDDEATRRSLSETTKHFPLNGKPGNERKDVDAQEMFKLDKGSAQIADDENAAACQIQRWWRTRARLG